MFEYTELEPIALVVGGRRLDAAEPPQPHAELKWTYIHLLNFYAELIHFISTEWQWSVAD